MIGPRRAHGLMGCFERNGFFLAFCFVYNLVSTTCPSFNYSALQSGLCNYGRFVLCVVYTRYITAGRINYTRVIKENA